MTRQRQWQIKQKQLGLCAKCNRPAALHTKGKRMGTNYVFCLMHLDELRERNRARTHFERWNQSGGDPIAWNPAVSWMSNKFTRVALPL
jgi:hypothetical protein